jgi:hypothetical protein
VVGYIAVFTFKRDGQPDLLFTVERNVLEPTPFLCAFHDGQHKNFGPLEDRCDVESVTNAAARRPSALGTQRGTMRRIALPDEPLAAGLHPDPLHAALHYWDGVVGTSATQARGQ